MVEVPVPFQHSGEQQRLRAVAALVVGLGDDADCKALPQDVYQELLKYVLPVWADKGPALVEGRRLRAGRQGGGWLDGHAQGCCGHTLEMHCGDEEKTRDKNAKRTDHRRKHTAPARTINR